MKQITTDSIRGWLSEIRVKSQLRLRKIAFGDCLQWRYENGRLVHATGRFFSIAGVQASGVRQALHGPQLAMIDQPEVGWLGFIIRRTPAGIQWLIQAKTEPGNINATHLAPSIQATPSNYQRAHGGNATAFLGLFESARTFLSDAPHSEQGTRFLWKFNRNSVLAIPQGEFPEIEGREHWKWCSSAVIRELLSDHYCVNTDARSVIATAPWALLAEDRRLFTADVLAQSYQRPVAPIVFPELLRQISPVGQAPTPRWESIDLDKLDSCSMNSCELRDSQWREMVSCFEIELEGREVSNWCQPFLMQSEPGDYVLFMRITDGGAEFFVRILHEVGFATRREFGPSLHCAFETPKEMQGWNSAQAATEMVRLMQSDEGGRFFQADACYRIVLTRAAPPRIQYPFGRWVSLAALEQLASRPGTTTNELRTLVSLALSRAFDTACAQL